MSPVNCAPSSVNGSVDRQFFKESRVEQTIEYITNSKDTYCFVKLWFQLYIFVGIFVPGHDVKGMCCGLHLKNCATG